ncbi:MAG: nuclear transport factor 2 family protein [Cellulophaga sp.]
MKNYIILIFSFLTLQFINAQSEGSLVEQTLQNYMEGSSYNKLEMLESAFTKNASLYLTNSNGEFKIYTPKEYAAFFKNRGVGEFNGRYAKVLAIEIIKDIATAKVEIRISKKGMIYIDLFLLKKTSDGWKIISKTATRIDNTETK